MSETRRRAMFGVVLVAVLAAGIGIGALVFGDDANDADDTVTGPTTSDAPGDGSSTSSTTTTAGGEDPGSPNPAPTISEEGLSGDALAFATALNQARDLSYHARYEGQGSLEDGRSTDIVVEVWRRLPLARRDFTILGAGQYFASREYRTTTGVTGCLDTSADGADDFQCTDAGGSASDPASPAFGAVDPHQGPVTAIDDSVDGVAVRCYRVAPAEGPPQEVCIDDGGIPLVIDDGELRLVRTVLDSAVTDADFIPPASDS